MVVALATLRAAAEGDLSAANEEINKARFSLIYWLLSAQTVFFLSDHLYALAVYMYINVYMYICTFASFPLWSSLCFFFLIFFLAVYVHICTFASFPLFFSLAFDADRLTPAMWNIIHSLYYLPFAKHFLSRQKIFLLECLNIKSIFFTHRFSPSPPPPPPTPAAPSLRWPPLSRGYREGSWDFSAR